MKKILSFVLSLCILLSVTPVGVVMAKETNRESVEELAHAIYQRLDNVQNNSVLEEGYKAYTAGDYQESLELFRNHFVEKLRKWERNYYPGYNLSSGSKLTAKLVAGTASLDDYPTDGNAAVVRDYLLDYFTPISDPDVSLYGKIDWLGGMDKPAGSGYWGRGQEVILSWMAGLPLAYYTDANDGKDYDIYLDRFMQILGDFSVNQKKVTDEYMIMTPNVSNSQRDGRFWIYTWHQNNERLGFIIGGLVQFSKLLPKEGETTTPNLRNNWDNIIPPFEKANPDYYDEIDCYHLAQWVVHIFEDAVPFMKKGLTADFASNMKESNKRMCATLMAIFSEFDLGKDFEEETSALAFNVWEAQYEDGTMIEASINYNDDTYNGMKGILRTFESMGVEEEWMEEYNYAITLYERFRENYKNSNLLTPKIGNGGDDLKIKPIWQNSTFLERYKQDNNYTYDENPPSYTSVHFPWGGYTTLRSGWEIENDISLSAYSSEVYGSGHTSLIQNAVWLTAYGRPLIQSGEGALYGESYVAEEERPNYDKWDSYFGEAATKKGSTVLVNDLDQVKYIDENAPDSERILRDARDKSPVSSRFGTSDYFDYVDGNYYLGYGTNNTKSIVDINHNRSNIMIREADLFIITDTMENDSGENKNYSQIWRYPHEEISKGYYGFNNDEVIVDGENNSIHTNETGTVNLFMTQFSNQDLSYKKYYGSKGDEQDGDGKYRGWSKSGISGDFMPSVDVYVNWEDNNQDKNTQVVTLAMPSRDENTPYKSLEDISDSQKGITGFSLTTNDDIVVTNLSSATKAELVIDDITAVAKNLVVTQNDGVIRGIVTDCEEIYYKDAYVGTKNDSFEFVIENNAIKELGAIEQKTAFAWIDTDDGYYPTYDIMTQKETNEFLDNIKERTDNLKKNRYNTQNTVEKLVNKDLSEVLDEYKRIDEIINDSIKNNITDAIISYLSQVDEISKFNKSEDFDEDILKILSSFKASIKKIDAKNEDSTQSILAVTEKIEKIEDRIKKTEYEEKKKTESDSSVVITPSMGPTTPICRFKDIETSWAKDVIIELYNKGLINGMTQDTFAPNNSMTRAEFVTLLLRVLGIEEENYNNAFEDVKQGDWYANAIGTAFSKGFVNGKDNGFMPNDKVTRQEAAKIIAIAAKMTAQDNKTEFIDNWQISDWAKEYVSSVQKAGLITGYPDGSFGPLKNITRAESAVIFQRLLNLLK